MAKIAILGKYYFPFKGGIERVTQEQAEYLARQHEVHVFVSAHDKVHGSFTLNGVHVHRVRRNLLLKSQPIGISMWRELRICDFDLIHFHGPNPFLAAVLYLKLKFCRETIPLVMTHHADVFGRKVLKMITNPFYLGLMKASDWVSVTSMKNYKSSTDLPRNISPVIIPLCINSEAYTLSQSEIDEARAWRAKEFGNKPLIGYVGRLARYKGVDVLLRAVQRLDGVSAIIAGDGPIRRELEALAVELGVSDRVHFLGEVGEERKKTIIAALDAFIFPSTETSEAFGIGQLEAMQIGTAVVASNLPTGVTDVAVDEVTALLARPGDDDHLSAQIERILTETDLAERLRTGARRHVRGKFDKDVVMSRYGSLIRQALSARTAPVVSVADG